MVATLLDKINLRLQRRQKENARVGLVDAFQTKSVQDLMAATTIMAAPPSDDVLGRSGSIARRRRPRDRAACGVSAHSCNDPSRAPRHRSMPNYADDALGLESLDPPPMGCSSARAGCAERP